MDTATAKLWRTIGSSLASAFRGAPGFESRPTPKGRLLLAGAPIVDFNWLLVDVGVDPGGQFRDFGKVLRTRELPGLVLLTESIGDRLGSIASELGLQPAGSVPLMVYRPTTDRVRDGEPTAASERFRVETVIAATLGEANRLATATLGIPLEIFDRVVCPSILDTSGAAFFLARDGEQPVSTVMTLAVGSTVGSGTWRPRPHGSGKLLAGPTWPTPWTTTGREGRNCSTFPRPRRESRSTNASGSGRWQSRRLCQRFLRAGAKPVGESRIHGRSTGDAVAEGLTVTARVITAAAAITVCVFFFVMAGDPETKQFGFGLGIAILIDATRVRLALVPATIEQLGDWN